MDFNKNSFSVDSILEYYFHKDYTMQNKSLQSC